MEASKLPPSYQDGTTGYDLSFVSAVAPTFSSYRSPTPSLATGGRGGKPFARTIDNLGLDPLGEKHTPAVGILCGRGQCDRRPTQRDAGRQAGGPPGDCSGRSAGGIQR